MKKKNPSNTYQLHILLPGNRPHRCIGIHWLGRYTQRNSNMGYWHIHWYLFDRCFQSNPVHTDTETGWYHSDRWLHSGRALIHTHRRLLRMWDRWTQHDNYMNTHWLNQYMFLRYDTVNLNTRQFLKKKNQETNLPLLKLRRKEGYCRKVVVVV